MIQYDGKNWSSLFPQMILMYKKSYNLKKLSVGMVLALVYASTMVYIHHYYEVKIVIDTFYFSLVGFILSLFLVFRLNSSYDKWWEGRKLLGKLVNDCRTLALYIDSLIDEADLKRRKFFVIQISNFCTCLCDHLQDHVDTGKLIFSNSRITKKLEEVEHKPVQICSFMVREIEALYRENLIVEIDKRNLKVQLQGLIDVLGGCERIHNTPIPFSHSSFIKLFIIFYLIVLPFGLINIFGSFTVIAVVFMTYALVGIEMISEEIEDPFGLEVNDLPTQSIASNISKNVYEILKMDKYFKATNNEEKISDPLLGSIKTIS